jgi:hypothetical protein
MEKIKIVVLFLFICAFPFFIVSHMILSIQERNLENQIKDYKPPFHNAIRFIPYSGAGRLIEPPILMVNDNGELYYRGKFLLQDPELVDDGLTKVFNQ